MINDSEFREVEDALGRYRPASPDAAKVDAIAAKLVTPRTPWRRYWLPIAVSVAAVLLIVVGTTFVVRKSTSRAPALVPIADISTEFSQAWLKQVRQELPWDDPKKPVVVAVFMDWQCIGCFVLDQNLMDAIQRLERDYPGRITIIFQDWPWDPVCNDAISAKSAPVHQGSCELARAVRRARDRGRDADLIGWLREHRETWKDVGLPEEFSVAPGEGEAAVLNSIALGKRLQITSTPTMFINGVRIDQGMIMPAQYIDWALRLELARANGQISK